MLPYAAFTSMSSMAAPAVGTPGSAATSGGGSLTDVTAPAPFVGSVSARTSDCSAVTSASSACCSSGTSSASSPSPRYAARTIGLACTSVGRAERDDLAEVEHVDVVARAHDEAHVVLDEQDREPGAGELDEQLGELGGLGLVETGRRLVEQHDARLGGQRARHLDQALGAGRQAVDALVGDRREADALDQLVGELTGLELLARPARAASPRRRARCRGR